MDPRSHPLYFKFDVSGEWRPVSLAQAFFVLIDTYRLPLVNEVVGTSARSSSSTYRGVGRQTAHYTLFIEVHIGGGGSKYRAWPVPDLDELARTGVLLE